MRVSPRYVNAKHVHARISVESLPQSCSPALPSQGKIDTSTIYLPGLSVVSEFSWHRHSLLLNHFNHFIDLKNIVIAVILNNQVFRLHCTLLSICHLRVSSTLLPDIFCGQHSLLGLSSGATAFGLGAKQAKGCASQEAQVVQDDGEDDSNEEPANLDFLSLPVSPASEHQYRVGCKCYHELVYDLFGVETVALKGTV